MSDLNPAISVTAIHLWTNGKEVFVNAEIEGRWVRIITETAHAPYSFICEANGMRSAARAAALSTKLEAQG